MPIGPILIFAPHPDDESLACAGVIARAASADPDGVRVVILTDGEGHLQACAYYHCRQEAQGETVQAGLKVGAVRILGRQAGKPRAWLAAYVADEQGEPASGTQLSLGDRRVETNGLGYALLEVPLSTLRPTLTVAVGHAQRRVPVSRVLGPDDRHIFGGQRRRESRIALAALGLPECGLSFWGCPDQGLSAILGGEGQAGWPERSLLEEQLYELLDSLRPAMIYVPHGNDTDSDHQATRDLVMTVLEGWNETLEVRSYCIHPQGSHDYWPPPPYRPPDRESRYQPDMPMYPPPGLPEPDLRLPLEGVLGPIDKGELLRLYETQMAADDNGFLLAFAKRDEIFWLERAGG
jgi:LmbE family N-acetylglucosaminyl deacetylase